MIDHIIMTGQICLCIYPFFLYKWIKQWNERQPHTTFCAMSDGGICCYILITLDGERSYCGTTNNFARRLTQHRNGHGAGGARYTSAHRHRDWTCLCMVRGFSNRSQCLSFEWRLKRSAAAGCHGCIERRCRQLTRTLENPAWWVRYPPHPTHMHVDWFHGTNPIHQSAPSTTPFDVIWHNMSTDPIISHPVSERNTTVLYDIQSSTTHHI